MIPYGRHSLDDSEILAVTEVLKSDWLTQGPRIPEFEQVLANTVQSKHAVALANGTAALHVACMALDVKKGDRVWTSPLSFVASANCALYCGATVDFIDIDPNTRNISIDELRTKLHSAAHSKTLPKVLVVVHFAGACCDMQAIYELAQSFQVKVIEDAAHALGSVYQKRPVGACVFSDLTCFSFHPVKNMAMGEGGAICTNNDVLALKVRELITHGVVRDTERFTNTSHAAWYYEQQTLGFNYRITDIQCALGLAQLKKLPHFIERRRSLVERYQEGFTNLSLMLPSELPSSLSAWHIYVIELPETLDRDALYQYLYTKGIACTVHYMPIHMHPFYQSLGFRSGDFPCSEAYFKRALTLPLFPDLTEQEQAHVIASVKEGLGR